MGYRRIEMSDIRYIIHLMRLGESDREISRSKIVGRKKASKIRKISEEKGWLFAETPFPSESELSKFFQNKKNNAESQLSTVAPYSELVKGWIKEGC